MPSSRRRPRCRRVASRDRGIEEQSHLMLDRALTDRFVHLLAERLERGVLTTEDSVRYTFFAAMLESGTRPHDVVLEYPHPAIPGARVDTVTLDENGEPKDAFEFKYHRRNPGGRNQPLPQQAGAVFADIRRLAHFEAPEIRCLVYLTDDEMECYWTNPSNGLDTLFNVPPDEKTGIDRAFMAQRSATLQKSAGDWPEVIRVTAHVLPDVPLGGHVLRMYGVTRTVPLR